MLKTLFQKEQRNYSSDLVTTLTFDFNKKKSSLNLKFVSLNRAFLYPDDNFCFIIYFVQNSAMHLDLGFFFRGQL